MADTREQLHAIAREQCWGMLAEVVDSDYIALSLAEPDALRQALSEVPEEWMRENPRYLMARELAMGSSIRFGMGLDAAFQQFARWVESSPTPATRDVLAVLQGRLRFFVVVGRLHDADIVATAILAAIDTAADIMEFVDFVPMLLIGVGVVRLLTGDVASAISSFSDAVRWSRVRCHHPIERYATSYLALGLAVAGDVSEAEKQLLHRSAAEPGRPGSLAHSYDTAGVLAEGMVALGRFDESATATAIAGFSDFTENGELWWIASHLRARHALYWGDRKQAISDLEARLVTHRGLGGPDALGGVLARSDLADLYQATGNYDAAAHVLHPSPTDRKHDVLLATRTRLELHQGRHDQALSRLASHALMATNRDFVPSGVLALKAAALKHLGADDRSRDSLAEAASGIRQTGALNLVAEAPPEIRADLAHLVDMDAAGLPVIFAAPSPVKLTAREQDVLEALRQHRSVKGIAVALHISPNTAKTHLGSLYRKLSVHTREQALQAHSRPPA